MDTSHITIFEHRSAQRSDCVFLETRTANTFACPHANVWPVSWTTEHGPTHLVGRVSERERAASQGRRRVLQKNVAA